MVSIAEYRKILNDQKSSDEQIQKRIDYLVAFCKNIISIELETYVKQNNNKQTSKRSRHTRG